MLFEVELPQAFVLVTKYNPELVTFIVGVVELLLHTPPLLPLSITEPPAQNVVLPLADITLAVGRGLTVTLVTADVEEHPEIFVTVTE